MSWTRTRRRRPAPMGTPWSPDEIQALTDAVDRAPSVHNTRPWSLDVRGRTATLWQRRDRELSRHDPYGRDRRISCGAAVANLVLAVRNAGWSADLHWADNEDPPDLVAAVAAYEHQKPSAIDGQRYRAIRRRFSYRRAFEDRQLPYSTRETLRNAAVTSGTHARWVTGSSDALELSRLLTYAARVYHDDVRYQRELTGWTSPPGAQQWSGIPADALGTEGLSAVGLTTERTRVPDERTLAERIDREAVLVLDTPGDEPLAHLHAGKAMEQAWLAATSLGLAVSVMTQPLQLAEVRTDLAEVFGLPGTPQVLMRFGYRAADLEGNQLTEPAEEGSDQ